jgi:type IV pilus assembly protein PilX
MKTARCMTRRSGAPSRQGQQGITLIIALLVLVAMTLAGLALVRSVDTATLAAGNLAFRQSAVASADDGMETAIGDLRGMSLIAKESDSASDGYYAELPTTDKDFTGNATPADDTDDFDWSTAKTLAADAAGNSAAYVIHRLCSSSGALDASKCTTWKEDATLGESVSATQAVKGYREPHLDPSGGSMLGVYRITVRVTGPRNTVSYTQTIVIV